MGTIGVGTAGFFISEAADLANSQKPINGKFGLAAMAAVALAGGTAQAMLSYYEAKRQAKQRQLLMESAQSMPFQFKTIT